MIINDLQDTIMSLEDEEVAGKTEQLAYLQTNDCDCGFVEGESYFRCYWQSKTWNDSSGCVLVVNRSTPVNGEKIKVTVEFDHDCLKRNPQHSICFPIAGACESVKTIPVAHLSSTENFKKSLFYRLLQRTSLFKAISRYTANFCNVITRKIKFCFPIEDLFCNLQKLKHVSIWVCMHFKISDRRILFEINNSISFFDRLKVQR